MHKLNVYSMSTYEIINLEGLANAFLSGIAPGL